ncbi:MAG: efflux transporter, family, subunit [Chthoniobacter sp.]|nr:efflux transporter, family, subunit [Chthoniobacter sp.]
MTGANGRAGGIYHGSFSRQLIYDKSYASLPEWLNQLLLRAHFSPSALMFAAQEKHRPALRQALGQLDTVRALQGDPGQFWRAFMEVLLPLIGAEEAVLLSREIGGGDAEPWRELLHSPAAGVLLPLLKQEHEEFNRLGREAEQHGSSLASLTEDSGATAVVVAARFLTGDAARITLAVCKLEPNASAQDAITRLRLLAHQPLVFELQRSLTNARHDMARFATTLDLLVLLNAQTRFAAAAMLLCNELATRCRAERVSLGWVETDRVLLQAVSHTEKFEKKMAIVRDLELAMDEAVDQDEEVGWPPLPESTAVTRDHEAFARNNGVQHLVSIPLRLDGFVVGVLTLERASDGFPLEELQGLRLLCDQIARRLQELKARSRWIGARLAIALREKASGLLGVENTWAKLGTLAAVLALGVLLFAKAEYRVEAPFLLNSDLVAQLPAPFDGYIDEVLFRVGDPVKAGQPLLALDTRDLLLQEAAAIAEQQRFLGEAQKAESDDSVADMRIALAAAEEAKARLDIVRHRLSQAKLAATFDGFVVEGDLRERVASPVKQGDVLIKVAKLEQMYVEVAMPERDVHELRTGQTGEIAFASRPQQTFPIEVAQVEPSAEIRDQGNVFIVRCRLREGHQPWWRPGMSGVAKVNAGRRTLFWIVTHRTTDFLRLYFWW